MLSRRFFELRRERVFRLLFLLFLLLVFLVLFLRPVQCWHSNFARCTAPVQQTRQHDAAVLRVVNLLLLLFRELFYLPRKQVSRHLLRRALGVPYGEIGEAAKRRQLLQSNLVELLRVFHLGHLCFTREDLLRALCTFAMHKQRDQRAQLRFRY